MKSKCVFLILNYVLFLVLAEENPQKRSLVVLETDNIQTASQHDGLPSNNSIGYEPSDTDAANFINYCTEKTLTNGTTLHGGSCNGVVMGDIPSENHMVSTIITYPFTGAILPSRKTFPVKFQVSNLNAGSVTNPESTLFSAPQALKDGRVLGHAQVTIQALTEGINSGTPPDPTRFAFFQTIIDGGDGRGGFAVTVEGGLLEGVYRVCTMAASRNHQPVLMPVVQRGAQDDCQRFTIENTLAV